MQRFALLIILSALIFGCQASGSQIRVRYIVDWREYRSGTLLVTLEFIGSARPDLLVGRERMRASDLRAFISGAGSVPLLSEEKPGVILARLPATSRLERLSYRVSPGLILEKPQLGEDLGYRVGYLGDSFALVDGASLFLLPDNYGQLAEASVRFVNLPQDLVWVTTLDAHGSEFTPSAQGGNSLAEQLHTSIMALGRFHQERFERDGLALDLYVEDAVRSTLKDVPGAELFEKLRFFKERLAGGQVPAQSHTLVLVPHDSEGRGVLVAPSARGQAISVRHWTSQVEEKIYSEMVLGSLLYQPFGLRYSAETLWIAEGCARYLSARQAHDRAGLSQRMRAVYDNYFIDPRITFASLRQVSGERKLGEPLRYSDKAMLAVNQIDRALMQEGRDIFDLIHGLRSEGRATDLRAALKPWVAPAEFEKISAVIEEKDAMIGPETLPDPPPTLAFQDAQQMVAQQVDAPSPSAFRIIHTARTLGFLETCGCKTNEWGGLAKRASALNQLRSTARHSLAVDAGDYFPEEIRAHRLKDLALQELPVSLDSLEWMGYDALSIGLNELRNSVSLFQQSVGGRNLNLVSSNLSTGGLPLAPPYRLTRMGPLRVQIIGAWSYKEPPFYREFFLDAAYGVAVSDPAAAVAAAVEREAGNVDLVMVIGNLEPGAAQAVVDRAPEVDLIVTGERHRIAYDGIPNRADDQATLRLIREYQPLRYKDTLILFSSSDAYAVSYLDFKFVEGRIADAAPRFLPLSGELTEDPRVQARIERFYAGLGGLDQTATPLFDWDPVTRQQSLVGVQECRGCHPSEAESWGQTRHAVAFKELVIRRRDRLPDCVSCHVTGFGASPGFRDARDSFRFGGVQCEVCHGPGSRHAQDPARAGMRRTPSEAVCRTCHTPAHSNHFDFEQRLPKVSHGTREPSQIFSPQAGSSH